MGIRLSGSRCLTDPPSQVPTLFLEFGSLAVLPCGDGLPGGSRTCPCTLEHWYRTGGAQEGWNFGGAAGQPTHLREPLGNEKQTIKFPSPKVILACLISGEGVLG